MYMSRAWCQLAGIEPSCQHPSCHCKLLQENTYFLLSSFSKKKLYDGSDSLKMVGNDCLILEKNADALLSHLLGKNETFDSPSAIKLRGCLELYTRWADLAR